MLRRFLPLLHQEFLVQFEIRWLSVQQRCRLFLWYNAILFKNVRYNCAWSLQILSPSYVTDHLLRIVSVSCGG